MIEYQTILQEYELRLLRGEKLSQYEMTEAIRAARRIIRTLQNEVSAAQLTEIRQFGT